MLVFLTCWNTVYPVKSRCNHQLQNFQVWVQHQLLCLCPNSRDICQVLQVAPLLCWLQMKVQSLPSSSLLLGGKKKCTEPHPPPKSLSNLRVPFSVIAWSGTWAMATVWGHTDVALPFLQGVKVVSTCCTILGLWNWRDSEQASPKCASVANGLFWVEDNRGSKDLGRVFSLPPHLPKRI